jgi:hypothetical protein
MLVLRDFQVFRAFGRSGEHSGRALVFFLNSKAKHPQYGVALRFATVLK